MFSKRKVVRREIEVGDICLTSKSVFNAAKNKKHYKLHDVCKEDLNRALGEAYLVTKVNCFGSKNMVEAIPILFDKELGKKIARVQYYSNEHKHDLAPYRMYSQSIKENKLKTIVSKNSLSPISNIDNREKYYAYLKNTRSIDEFYHGDREESQHFNLHDATLNYIKNYMI